MNNYIDYIQDYISSDNFLFLDSQLKENAESLIHQFLSTTGNSITFTTMDNALKEMGKLDLDLQIKKAIPNLISEYFSYLSTSGKIPNASSLAEDILLLEKNYLKKFRDDGSIKGETFKKNYTDVGRNDPCPCGSGKKFKKCCMDLIS